MTHQTIALCLIFLAAIVAALALIKEFVKWQALFCLLLAAFLWWH